MRWRADRYQEMVTTALKEFAPKDRPLIAVELGSSYGNTTLAYKCGYKVSAYLLLNMRSQTGA